MVLFSHGVNAQDYTEIIDNDSIETNEERVQTIIDFMRTVEFERCADIGSGNMELILQIADAYPGKRFVLEDIDSARCNRSKMNAQIERLELEHIDTGLITICIGSEGSTTLAAGQFDLVLISGLIHEIDDKAAFLSEVRRILKPQGQLIISDAFYAKQPKPHAGCANPFLTFEEMQQLLDQQGLRVKKEWRRTGISTASNGTYESRIMLCSFED